jgi:signal transduction histidine kinase
MHRLLQRQLKKYMGKHFADLDSIPLEWQDFIHSVDEAYSQYDGDYIMIERSLELSSAELLQANNQLRGLLKTVEGQVTERTTELTAANTALEQTLVNLQQTQVHLIQAEKMSSLGQLIAGIAHEINNPVNFIHGNLSYLRNYGIDLLKFIELSYDCCKEMTPEMQQLAEDIDLEFVRADLPKIIGSMEIGTNRIREIVLSLRNFSHMDEAEFKMVDIHEGIDNSLLILDHRLKSKSSSKLIQVIKQYADLPLVNCYAGQLNQVFVNILANAIDALEEVRSKTDQAEQPFISIQTKLVGDRYIEIAIADNGSGIPESIQQQIFNPFFTTKPVGKGTGMGMAISYQIINEKHKGKLICSSIVGKGTEFIIQIPL